MLDINGSVAVITGGSGGIGMALAQYWVKQGGQHRIDWRMPLPAS